MSNIIDDLEAVELASKSLDSVIAAAKSWNDLQLVLSSMNIAKALEISRAELKRIGIGKSDGRALQCLIRVAEASLKEYKEVPLPDPIRFCSDPGPHSLLCNTKPPERFCDDL